MPSTQTDNKAKSVRSQRLEARITQEQKRLFVKAAALEGRSLTDFVVSSVQEAAMRTVRDYEILRLERQDQELFVAALLDSTPPGEALRAAAQRYKERAGS
jgi:uncharacterized protein (DUF1778 family)